MVEFENLPIDKRVPMIIPGVVLYAEGGNLGLAAPGEVLVKEGGILHELSDVRGDLRRLIGHGAQLRTLRLHVLKALCQLYGSALLRAFRQRLHALHQSRDANLRLRGRRGGRVRRGGDVGQLPGVDQPGDVFGHGAHAGAVDHIAHTRHASSAGDVCCAAVDDGGSVQDAGNLGACAATLGVVSVSARLVHLLIHAAGEYERGQ